MGGEDAVVDYECWVVCFGRHGGKRVRLIQLMTWESDLPIGREDRTH